MTTLKEFDASREGTNVSMVNTTSMPMSRADIEAAGERACRRIAPVWPLRHFVAVNPYLGLVDMPFESAAATLAETAGAATILPRTELVAAVASGEIRDEDLADALTDAPTLPGFPDTPAALLAAAKAPLPSIPLLPTVADVATEVGERDFAGFAVERISAFAASHFDEGQAAWRSPWHDGTPYAAWRAQALTDRTPGIMGLDGFRAAVALLPDDPEPDLQGLLLAIDFPPEHCEAYFHRLLRTIGGWAAYARYRGWQAELAGDTDRTLVGMLAVRLAFDVVLFECLREDGTFRARWDEAVGAYANASRPAGLERELAIDATLQRARERAYQRRLAADFATVGSGAEPDDQTRPAVQAAFCIDVRSEIYRRCLESVGTDIETIGFAGFFGFPIEYVPIGQTHGGAQCPVLLTPKFVVAETVQGAGEDERSEILGMRLMRRRAAKAWKSFKLAAVSSFSFVDTVGLTYLAKLATDGFGLTRPVTAPGTDGLAPDVQRRLAPKIEASELAGRSTGFDASARVDMAASVLGAMSMHGNFGRLVLLVGHGSTTVNNPHATGLDCGACGGHTGEANARVATAILNDPVVREGLAARGLDVPEDTVFVGALHDTTTDEVTLFDESLVPVSHREELAALREKLAAAARMARAERAGALRIDPREPIDAQILERTRDWSQVRPEWGLAGCAAFIAAPRHRTAGLDLGGRSFLHSYEWQSDEGFGVLELIMTAPMVVASWISLQYYGSSVDNVVFGAGNKTLHNVVGLAGVLEGNGGDLRVGLPFQSVHDGERLVHSPLRLSVAIEAPIEAINDIIERHETVRALVDNGWLYLLHIDDDGNIDRRWAGGLSWEPLPGQSVDEVASALASTA